MKKLHREPKGAVLAGVCSGLGVYFNMSPNIFRVAFVLLAVFHPTSWVAIVGYIAVAAIMPQGDRPKDPQQREVKYPFQQPPEQRPNAHASKNPQQNRGFDTSNARDAEIRSSTMRKPPYTSHKTYSEEEFYKESRKHKDDFYQ